MEKIIMKTVLAELHELINDLEDQGLTAEASTLQEVFVRVAEEADMDEMEEPAEDDDLANDVAGLLKSHPAAKVLAEIAKQMGGEGASDASDETSSFAYYGGNSDEYPEVPIEDDDNFITRNQIVTDFSHQYLVSGGNPNELRDKAQQMLDDMIKNGDISPADAKPVGVEEITRGPGYNSKAEMNKALGGPQRPGRSLND